MHRTHRSHIRRRGIALVSALAAGFALVSSSTRPAAAQSRPLPDTTNRVKHLRHDVVYGVVEGLAFAGVDQLQNDPSQWGKGWSGYGKRAASNVGEFVVQEGVTAGLSAVMHRPLDYQRCSCKSTSNRIGWAFKTTVVDPMPDGTTPLAIPRIVGAYIGSFAQAAWRPKSAGRARRGSGSRTELFRWRSVR